MQAEKIVARASDALFGHPLITNVHRAVLVEAMIAEALPDWSWCARDYASWDFQHPDGLRLEVKQSAFKQSWTSEKPSRPQWDIRQRTGFWKDRDDGSEGADWVLQTGRNAEIYVFGLHTIYDDNADHRRPDQWRFFVIREKDLPQTQMLALPKAKTLATPVLIGDLAAEVASVVRRLNL